MKAVNVEGRSSSSSAQMPVSVKVYYGSPSSAVEIRRFIFRPEQHRASSGIYHALLERIRALFNGLNLRDVHLCWKDDDGDYVVFSSDDELKVAITNTTDNTLRIYIREKELPVRVVGASGSGNSGVVAGNNAVGSVALATAAGTSRHPTTADQQTSQDRHHGHRHHYHTTAGHVRRSNRSESSARDQRDTTPGLVRHHRSTVPGVDETLTKDLGDHLHLDDDVLLVAVDQPSSPNMTANTNHVGERGHHSDHNRDRDVHHHASTNAATVAAACVSASTASTASIVCSECRGEGRGVWYRCTVCADFYLCSECENRGLHDQHIMVRISGSNVQSRHSTPNYNYHR